MAVNRMHVIKVLSIVTLLVLAGLGGSSALRAQAASDQPNAVSSPSGFQVSVIKPSRPDTQERWNQSLDHFLATNQTLANEIAFAYDIRPTAIICKDKWVREERYDFLAKASDSDIEKGRALSQIAQMEEVREDLQMLLADRFHLQFTWETRSMPGFALTVAKSGPHLQPPTSNDSGALVIGRGVIKARHITLDDFAGYLESASDVGGRQIINRTDMGGYFSLTLRWSSIDDSTPSAASLFTAIQEQLGLRLEPTMIPTKVLVIDHVERPTPN